MKQGIRLRLSSGGHAGPVRFRQSNTSQAYFWTNHAVSPKP